MKIKQIISGLITSVLMFFGQMGLRSEDSAGVKEYLVKFKTSDQVFIKTLAEKYQVEFKEEIPVLKVYSIKVAAEIVSTYNDNVIEELRKEPLVEYIEPNVDAWTTYADVGGMQEIITDAPWYLAPNRTEIPILLF
ncbi:MAG: hypothetical protein AAB019_10265, partial [Planctomycetota bacterium]